MNNYIFPFLWMRGEPEEVIRQEIGKIWECGIRAICVEARPHDDFCGPGWWHDMDIVIDEAKKRDMKIWILDDKHFPTGYAAGLIESKYPERKKWFLADTTADIFGGQHEKTLNVQRMLKPVIGFWQIGQPVNEEERKNNQLLAIVATRFTDQNVFSEETIDLTDRCRDGFVSFTLPEGQWRVHVIYKTRTDGGKEDYINMLDRESAHTQIEGVYEAHYQRYGAEFGKTIAGFFSDEPEIGNVDSVSNEEKVGKPGMPLPWSDELEGMLKERYGEEYKSFLPFLFAGTDAMNLCLQMRYDFMDCATRLYEQNFSRAIGDWCREHGVEYIGHVVEDGGSHSRLGHGPGHWFRAMAGQDMAGIDVIGSQVIFGAPIQDRKGMGGLGIDGEFFHYALGKMGASAGHLDPLKKGRTMCELFGAYGWSFGVRDMKYLLDHLLSRGVNHLVPHAFSMADYPDIDCPPHFYARGNNPQFPWFAQLMKYANRMCGQLNGGTHAANVAVLYDGEADWVGSAMPMQKVCRELLEHQVEFDVVALDMLQDLERYNGKLGAKQLEINGVVFGALIIPHTKYIPEALSGFIARSGAFPVYFIDAYPEKVVEKRIACNREETGEVPAAAFKDHSQVVSLGQLADLIRENGMADITICPECSGISVYHYRKDREMFFLMNECPDQTYEGTIVLPVKEEMVCYDGMTDRYLDIPSKLTDGKREVAMELAPGQSMLLLERKNSSGEGTWIPMRHQLEGCTGSMDISKGWRVELARAKDYPRFDERLEMEKLSPVSDTKPAFSGIMRYTKTIKLAQPVKKAYFCAEHVYEVLRLSINGQDAGMCLTPPYQLEIGKFLREGSNELVVEVANTPGRDQQNYPAAPFDFSHEPQEPSGMFGEVKLVVQKNI